MSSASVFSFFVLTLCISNSAKFSHYLLQKCGTRDTVLCSFLILSGTSGKSSRAALVTHVQCFAWRSCFHYRISIGNALLEIQENLHITSDGTESGGLRVEG